MKRGPRLRVLRIAPVFSPPACPGNRLAAYDPFGGMQSHTGQLSAALDDLGVAQTVVTSWRPGAEWRTALGRHGSVLRLGVPLRSGRQLYALAALRGVHELARGCDVVHVHLGEDLAVVPLGLVAARAARAPLILTLHCSLRHTFRGRGMRGGLLRTAGGPLETLGARAAARVITLADRTADALAAGGTPRERIRVIPSGVDLRLFADCPDDPLPDLTGHRVLFVGRLTAQKDPVAAVEAVARMGEEASLVVVGDGPLRGAVTAAVRRQGLTGRTRLVGFVPMSRCPPTFGTRTRSWCRRPTRSSGPCWSRPWPRGCPRSPTRSAASRRRSRTARPGCSSTPAPWAASPQGSTGCWATPRSAGGWPAEDGRRHTATTGRTSPPR